MKALSKYAAMSSYLKEKPNNYSQAINKLDELVAVS